MAFPYSNASKRCRGNCKQCRPWSDSRSSLIWVCTYCPDLSVRKLGKITVWHFSSSVYSFFKHACAAIQWARYLIFGGTLWLLYLMYANSKGSGETLRMHRLAWAFVGRLCNKYHNLMSWLKVFSLKFWMDHLATLPTVEIRKIRTPEKIAVTILNLFEWLSFTI